MGTKKLGLHFNVDWNPILTRHSRKRRTKFFITALSPQAGSVVPYVHQGRISELAQANFPV